MTAAYHRLARTAPHYRWWKALVTGLIAAVIYAVSVVAAGFVALLAVLATAAADGSLQLDGLDLETGEIDPAVLLDLTNPAVLTFALGIVALMLPAIILARLIMGPRPLGLISSVEGRLRWWWLRRLALPALIVWSAALGVSLFGLDPLLSGRAPGVVVDANTWLLLLVVVLLVPLQATAEEYVYRGYLMQAIGGWLRHPAFAILIPVPFFVFSHGYDVWGQLDVAVFAVAAGWLTWKTGGLEAAIVAHVVNNALAFALGAFGLVDLNQAEGSPVGVLLTVLIMAAYSWVVLRMARTAGLKTERDVQHPADAEPSSPIPVGR